MFGYLLNLVYLLVLCVTSPWLIYAAVRKGKYREGWSAKLLGRTPRRHGNRPCIWLHAVSVGELQLLAPLLSELRLRAPEWQCVISTTTRTGFALAKEKYHDHLVFYCPLDFTWSTAAAMRRIRPDVLLLVELEIWPNLLHAARRYGAKVAIVNGRLSERSYRGYRRIGPLIAPTLAKIDLIAAQTQQYADRFVQLGARPEAVHASGSLKFDGARSDRDNAQTVELRELAHIADDDIVFLAGSTQAPEEQLALKAFLALASEYPKLRLIIVPRHPERFSEVAAMLDASGAGWQLRSQLDCNSRGSDPRILLVDTVGELGAWWGAAGIGFVGGSFGSRGGQNMIEPAGYGVATCFGPNTRNFRDVVSLLLDREAAVVVQDESQLTGFVRRCLADSSYTAQLGTAAARVVAENRGAGALTLRLLSEHCLRATAPKTNQRHAA